MKMNAIVLAGGIPQPGDPLYVYSNGDSKALIDVAGKPMVQWILDALGEAKSVDNVIVIGLTPKSGLTCKKPLHFISNQGRMLANIIVGSEKSLELSPKGNYLLVCSADIPALKGSMVDWLVKTAMQTDDELYYGVCPKDVMEARYPTSNRTYTKLKDIELCGADVNIARISAIKEHLDTWEALIGNRKSPLRQAAVVGFDTLIQLATRQFTLDALVERASQRIGIKGRAIIWNRAEPCMDVDKPHQLELMRADLASQRPAVKKVAAKKPAVKKTVKAAPVKTSNKRTTTKQK
ncbi:MAG: nucleotidyltransferase family protein [Anaerolineales bacterium]|jgi:molybdopterin-guanine dinucleotide biosynthesis protein A|nr:nucleotidyltransferase family protein [Anaerolineales bacterium]